LLFVKFITEAKDFCVFFYEKSKLLKMTKKQITIEVFAHESNGRHIGSEQLDAICWDMKNIGGEVISTDFIFSTIQKAGHYLVVFEFDCKLESPFITPHLAVKPI